MEMRGKLSSVESRDEVKQMELWVWSLGLVGLLERGYCVWGLG